MIIHHMTIKKRKSSASAFCFSLRLLAFLHRAQYPNHDARHDKRDAQPLAHVPSHVLLEINLHILQELNADARTENDNQKDAEHHARLTVAEVAFVVHPKQNTHGHKAKESLIQTRRMAREPLVRRTAIAHRAWIIIIKSAAELFLATHEDKTPR